jgi:enediyne biosynthesis protein E7
VVLLPYAMHRHPAYWSNPETFDPDRWDGMPDAPAPFSYIPFLEGPRKCIGRDLAELVFVATVSAVIGHFDLELIDDGAEVLPYVIPRFDRPLPFRLRAIA